MPFGLRNVPISFQRMMDEILRQYLYNECSVYMNHVTIFSKALQNHIYVIKLTFSALDKANIKVPLNKSEFLTKCSLA